MSEKPYMDIESEFDPKLMQIVRKYSLEERKWSMEHGGREILEKYPDLASESLPVKDVIETWKNVETGINPLADLVERIEKLILPELGDIVLEQSDQKTEKIKIAQAYLSWAEILKDMLVKYTAAKDTIVAYHSRLAQTAVNLAGESNVYAELEKREFRKKVHKTVFPTLAAAIEAEKEAWGKTEQASEAYDLHLSFIKTNPVLSQEIMDRFPEYDKESLDRRKSLFQENRKFTEAKLREMYEENE